MGALTKDVSNKAPSSRKATNDISPSAQSTPWHTLQRTLGNQGVQRLLRADATQAKHRSGQPNDLYERDADRVAEQVMRVPFPGAAAPATSHIVSLSIPGVQRKCACGGPLDMSGECAECSKKKLGLQTKLRIGEPGDAYEQEADRVAAQVMLMPEPADETARDHGAARAAHCSEREAGKTALVQRRTDRASEGSTSVPNDIAKSLGPAQPLTAATRAFFEPRFGREFGNVRVHAERQAAQTAGSINAKAFTVGRAIAFGAGQYAPESREGRALLAHELAHVVQQSGGSYSAEKRGRKAHTGLSRSDVVVQRQPPIGANPPASGASGSRSDGVVIVLGSWDQQVTIPGLGPITLPTEGSQALLRGQAVAVFPGHEPAEVMQLPGAFGRRGDSPGAFPAIAEEGRRDRERGRPGPPGWQGLPSGVAVQEALEGGSTIRGLPVRAIFINVDNVDLEHDRQTSSEYRQIVSALASGRNTEVDIVVRHGPHISIVRRGSSTVEGDPLPTALRRHLPPTFQTLAPGGTSGTSGGSEDEGQTARRRPPTTRTGTARRGVRSRTPATARGTAPSRSASSRSTTPRARRGGGALLGGAAVGGAILDIGSIYLEQWLQEEYFDPQNRTAFNRNLESEQPRIDRMLTRRRAAAQQIRARGGTPYAVVTLHVVYRTFGMEDGLSHSSFQDLWVERVSIASAPREEQRGVYEGRNPLETLFDLEAQGRLFRDESHTLITYSFEIPDSGAFARRSIEDLAEVLVDMHRYVARLTERGEVPEEISGVVLEMQRAADGAIDFEDRQAREELRRQLIVVAGGNTAVAADVITLLQMRSH